jgi:hypothetical protein
VNVLLFLPAAALANIYAQDAVPAIDCYDTPQGVICFEHDQPPNDLEHPNPDNPENDK